MDMKKRLSDAIGNGPQAARIELGIARMAQKETARGNTGRWYVARKIDPVATPDGPVRRYQLLSEELEADQVTRKWADTLGEAHEYHGFRDAMSACVLQGQGVPMHEREARKVCIGNGVAVLDSARGIDR